jgi:hypothetical protein
MEQKLIELEHKQDLKFLDQKKELASFRNNSILEDRFNQLEAKVFVDCKQTQYQMQVTSVILLNFT